MRSWVHRLASPLVTCLALLVLPGCAGLQSSIVGRAMDQLMPGQPLVNAYYFSKLPAGPWVAVSTWRVLGPDSSQSEVYLQDLGQFPPLNLKIATLEDAKASVLHRLLEVGDGCDSPIQQLKDALERVDAVLEVWPRLGLAPTVRLVVIPPFVGAAGVRLSLSRNVESLELHVATQLPEATTCIWTRYWVTETVDTIFHELAHLRSFSERGRAVDLLREEFLAYGIGECVYRAIEGHDVPRNRSFPGLQTMSFDQILLALDQRRLPPTIAARFLAHQYWAYERTRRTSLDWRIACQRLQSEYPDPRRLFNES